MAKYSRHDHRNKKRDKHKQYAKEGFKGGIHTGEYKRKPKYESDLSVLDY